MEKEEKAIMKVYIDSREKEKIPLFQQYVKAGKSKIITDVEVGMYETSDANSGDGIVGIERKHKDFLSSIYDGTLDQQLKELSDNFEHAYLFIEYEGLMDIISQNPLANPDTIMGKVASVMARKDITPCFVGDFYVHMVCKTISCFYDGRTPIKEISYTPLRHRGMKTKKKRKPTVKEVQLDALSRIPNLGAKIALHLLEQFDFSIQKIAKADMKELQKTPGVGKKMATYIQEVFK